MAWDSTRPVPWQRLIREWLIYAAIMMVLFMVLLRDQPLGGVLVGLFFSGPLYLGVGYVMAKLGYQRRSAKDIRAARDAGGTKPKAGTDSASDDGVRPKPAPTRRTGAATGSRPKNRKKR